jgi:glucosamine-6-phosphate deaminase
MKIIRVNSYEEMSRKAADLIGEEINRKPDLVLGLATGSTPKGTYAQLVSDYEKGKVDFSLVRTVNLDEYAGLSPESPHSYRYFMNTQLFDHINIDPANTHIPDGLSDEEEECARYEQLITSLGGIDLQLLGLGHNGHIGFNEPADEYARYTHPVELTESTIQANSRLFENVRDMPRRALTMGVGTIMQAERILLIVSGEGKREALKQTLSGPIRPDFPASVLQLHRDVTVIAEADVF